MKTTLNKIREHSPCTPGWEKLLRSLNKTSADDKPLAITTILNSNGLDDALWCLRAVEGHDREIRLYAVWCARQVQHLMMDKRSLDALDVAERFANGQATEAELDAACDAAWDAAWDAWDAAGAAARASAKAAARASAGAAARDARASAGAAARAAAVDAWASAKAAARASAKAAAWDAAWDAVRAAQEKQLRIVCAEGEMK